MSDKPRVSMIQERRATLVGRPENRRMAAALSSEEPVERVFGTEILVHRPESIDMSRAAKGLPLLINHERNRLPIGRVENVHLGEDSRLRGDLVFSEATEEARAAYSLVEDGTLSDVSISYRVLDWQRGDNDDINVTRWTPLEASVVSVPADGSVGIGRSLPTESEATMPDETTKPDAGAAAPSIIETVRERSGTGYQSGAAAENARLTAITSTAAQLSRSMPSIADQLEALAEEARGDLSVTAERFNSLALELLGCQAQPVSLEAPAQAERIAVQRPGNQHRGIVTAGDDVRERAAVGMVNAIYERAGGELKPEEIAGNHYRGWSMMDIGRACLEFAGVETRGHSSEQLAKMMIAQRAVDGAPQYATADFPQVTANVFFKRVNDAFAAADVTWDMWCSSTEVADFRQFNIPRISQFTSLPIVAEDADYTNLTRVDAQETATLVKYGGISSLTMEAIINDDQRMFSATATSLGEAAARTLDETVYAVLTTNAVMGDAVALFAAGHSNTGTNALALAGITASRTALARQTDDNGELLGVRLAHLIVPEELRDTAEDLATSEWLVDVSGTAQRVNTVRGTFTVVSTVRLTDVNDWFAVGRAGQTIEVAFLRGNRTPTIERENGWVRDALHWKIRHPHIAYALDWRGMYRNVVA